MTAAAIWRWGASLLPSLGITITLFLLMILLIKTGDRVKNEVNLHSIRDVVMPDRRVDVLDIPEPEPPPEIESPPDTPEQPPPQNENQVVLPRYNLKISTNPGNPLNQIGQNSELVPIVRVNPNYPERAAQRGIEGWVILEFSINTEGKTKNARVIANEPSGIFDSAALRAISKWRYSPRMVDGEAIQVDQVQVRLTFNLTKSNSGRRNLF